MILLDVSVLVYAFDAGFDEHVAMRSWLQAVLGGDEAFGVHDLVLSGFLRIATHPRVLARPAPTAVALDFAHAVRERPQRVDVRPGTRHWSIFVELCRSAGVRGNLVPDAYLAALAIESGSEWVTTDRGFARFPGLRWRHPLAGLASN